jgi:hypothetical protein
MVADGFAVTEDAYIKASAIAAQSPGVTQFKVFPRAAANAQVLNLTPTRFDVGFKYTLTINGTVCTYTVVEDDEAAEVCAGLVAAIDVDGVTDTDHSTYISLEPDAPTARVYLKNVSRELTVAETSGDAGIATDLAAAQLADPDWYGLLIDSQSKAEIVAAAAWCEANKKLFLAQTSDGAVVTNASDDVASSVQDAGYHRTAVCYSRDMAGQFAAGLLSRQLSRNPGTSTFWGKTVAGAVADALTPSEFGFATGKNALVFHNENGLKTTFDGKAGSGRYLDITHGTDWLLATMAQDVKIVMLSQEKIDFDDNGIGLIESAMRKRLEISSGRKFTAATFTVTMPKAADVSTADKGDRVLADPQFSVAIRGAIQETHINGSLTL